MTTPPGGRARYLPSRIQADARCATERTNRVVDGAGPVLCDEGQQTPRGACRSEARVAISLAADLLRGTGSARGARGKKFPYPQCSDVLLFIAGKVIAAVVTALGVRLSPSSSFWDLVLWAAL
jgi:hypothetical protein